MTRASVLSTFSAAACLLMPKLGGASRGVKSTCPARRKREGQR